MAKPITANVSAGECDVRCRRSAAGELKLGIIEPSIGIQPRRMVWLSTNEAIARFGIDGAKALVERACECMEDT